MKGAGAEPQRKTKRVSKQPVVQQEGKARAAALPSLLEPLIVTNNPGAASNWTTADIYPQLKIQDASSLFSSRSLKNRRVVLTILKT